MAERVSSELFQRVVAATILIPVALAAVYFGGWAFSLLAAIAVTLMICEWEPATGGERTGRHTLVGIITALAALSVVSFGSFQWALILIGVGTFVDLIVPRRHGTYSHWPAVGLIAIGIPAVCLVWLRGASEGMTVIVWLLVVLWATDSGAYFVGKWIGGARLAPTISPGKTWAGFVGGTGAGVLVGVATVTVLPDISTIRAVLASILVSLAGQGGDLAVSAVKRRFGVKDMGTIIPGHGGVLDRLDSLLFGAMAVVALAVASGGTVPLWP